MNTDQELERLGYMMNQFSANNNKNLKAEKTTLTGKLASRTMNSISNSFEFYVIRELKKMLAHKLRKEVADIAYYVYQPMYSSIGASICSYLQATCLEKFDKVKDLWMRNVRNDVWFMVPYSIFFHKIDERTYVYARACVDESGGVSLSCYIIGKKMRREVKKLTYFERSTEIKGKAIKQITISAGKDHECVSDSGEIEARTIETIFIDEAQKNRIISFIERWKSREQLYRKACRIHKAGILLYGKPGTGKTSLIKALATLFDASLIIINPNDIAKFNSVTALKSKISETAGLKFVVLEDIDVIMNMNRDNQDKEDRTTMNGLMQILDGMLSTSETIFFATTNYIDRLDKVVTRPGRFDIKEELVDLSKDVAMKMAEYFELPEENFNEIWNNNASHEGTINPALLQGLILDAVFKDASDEVVDIEAASENEISSSVVTG